MNVEAVFAGAPYDVSLHTPGLYASTGAAHHNRIINPEAEINDSDILMDRLRRARVGAEPLAPMYCTALRSPRFMFADTSVDGVRVDSTNGVCGYHYRGGVVRGRAGYNQILFLAPSAEDPAYPWGMSMGYRIPASQITWPGLYGEDLSKFEFGNLIPNQRELVWSWEAKEQNMSGLWRFIATRLIPLTESAAPVASWRRLQCDIIRSLHLSLDGDRCMEDRVVRELHNPAMGLIAGSTQEKFARLPELAALVDNIKKGYTRFRRDSVVWTIVKNAEPSLRGYRETALNPQIAMRRADISWVVVFPTREILDKVVAVFNRGLWLLPQLDCFHYRGYSPIPLPGVCNGPAINKCSPVWMEGRGTRAYVKGLTASVAELSNLDLIYPGAWLAYLPEAAIAVDRQRWKKHIAAFDENLDMLLAASTPCSEHAEARRDQSGLLSRLWKTRAPSRSILDVLDRAKRYSIQAHRKTMNAILWASTLRPLDSPRVRRKEYKANLRGEKE